MAKGMKVRVLDPDVDVLEMERLKQAGGISENKIGFVSIAYKGERVNIPYHHG